MSYSHQTVFLCQEIMDQINRDADGLLANQGMWSKQNLVTGLEGFAYGILSGKYGITPPSPAPGTTVLKGVLQDIINSDQGPYEKLFNIKALLEVK